MNSEASANPAKEAEGKTKSQECIDWKSLYEAEKKEKDKFSTKNPGVEIC